MNRRADLRGTGGTPQVPRPAAVDLRWLRLSGLPRGWRPDETGLALLDQDERRRAEALRRPADRLRFVAAHLGKRTLLGRFLGVGPAEVDLFREPCPLCGQPHGRPAVRQPEDSAQALYFSMAHSGDLVLYGFAAVRIGVDVEAAHHGVRDIASLLHPRERRDLARLPPGAVPGALLRCWVRKEACLKGTGAGIGGGVAEPYVGVAGLPVAPPGWALADLDTEPGYAAAVAVAQPQAVVHARGFTLQAALPAMFQSAS